MASASLFSMIAISVEKRMDFMKIPLKLIPVHIFLISRGTVRGFNCFFKNRDLISPKSIFLIYQEFCTGLCNSIKEQF